MSLYLGDCHGCYETLMRIIEKLPKDEKIYYTGDLIDRGPKSKEVVEFVIKNNMITVLGNHEDMACRGLHIWQNNGAQATIKSYDLDWSLLRNRNVTSDEKVLSFKAHQKWMETLPLYLIIDDEVDEKGRKVLLTHSSASSAWKIPEEDRDMGTWFKDSLIWERDYNPQPIEGLYNIFGHTPLKEPLITEHYAAIDTGAVFGYKLTAIRFPSLEIYQQDFVDG